MSSVNMHAKWIVAIGSLVCLVLHGATPETSVVTSRREIESESMDLLEKARYFQARVLNQFSSEDCRLIMKYKSGGDDVRDVATTAHFLAALAFKYAVDKSSDDQALAREIIAGLIALDTSYGEYDGRLPVYANRTQNLKTPDEALTANGYTQLFFAYVTAYKLFDDPGIESMITEHTTKIAERYIDDDYILKDRDGNPLNHSNIYPSRRQWSKSRCLDTLVFQETVLFLVGDIYIRDKVKKLQADSINKNYLGKIRTLHFTILSVTLPTHATDWLNFIRLYTLIQSSGSPEYRASLKRLYRTQKHEKNPLFNSIYAICSSGYSDITKVFLDTFPIELDSRVVDNPDINPRFPRIVKWRVKREAPDPLPIYRRPLRSHNWKGNPSQLRGGDTGPDYLRYPGVDYLLAYWMHRYAQIHEIDCKQSNFRRSLATAGKDFRKLGENLTGVSINQPLALVVDDRKLERDQVKHRLELQGYSVLQAASKRSAKRLVRQHPFDVIISDLDLSHGGNFITGRDDGLEFLQWLSDQQKQGRFNSVQVVKLHSTIFNEDDFWGTLMSRYRKKTADRVRSLGYTVQPKTVLIAR